VHSRWLALGLTPTASWSQSREKGRERERAGSGAWKRKKGGGVRSVMAHGAQCSRLSSASGGGAPWKCCEGEGVQYGRVLWHMVRSG
jgi:hypothetical protein